MQGAAESRWEAGRLTSPAIGAPCRDLAGVHPVGHPVSPNVLRLAAFHCRSRRGTALAIPLNKKGPSELRPKGGLCLRAEQWHVQTIRQPETRSRNCGGEALDAAIHHKEHYWDSHDMVVIVANRACY
jgi:hypothetical protein